MSTRTSKPRTVRRVGLRVRSVAIVVLAQVALVLLPAVPIGLAASEASATTRATMVSSSVADVADLGDPHALENFLDGVVTTQLAANHIPGATVAVVKDGQLLLAKGYGAADMARGIPVQADATLFRVGSVSKLFTWTAVMQLKEQGKLDLNADVNKYLKTFQIPDTYPRHPITLAHLLTHTAGFEDRGIGTGAHANQMQPLGVWLAHNIPARVRLPGQVTSYSNYGATLAGYIVEQVSGQPFDTYIEQHILQPLGMSHSTFRQPVPPSLAADVSVGYSFGGGTYTAQPFEYVAPWPAGSMSATATDMANFMIAHLQNGRFGDTRILQDATAREMHAQHFTNDPRVPGFAYGFYESRLAGQRIIGHLGDTQWFHSELALLPEHNVGIFVSVNSINGQSAPAALVEAFVDRYYGGGPKALPPTALPGYADRAARIAGSYWPTRHSYTTLEKVTMLFSTMSVTATGNGHLSISLGVGSQALDVVEVAPWVFRQVRPQDFWMDVGTIVFQTDASGNVTSVLLGNVPMLAWQRTAWYETPGFHLLLILACLLFFIAALIVWPARYLLSPNGRQRVQAATSRMSALVTRRKAPPATTNAREPATVGVARSIATGAIAGAPADERASSHGSPEAGPAGSVGQPSLPPRIPAPAHAGEQSLAQPALPDLVPSAAATAPQSETLATSPGTYPGLMLGGWRWSREGLGPLAHWLAGMASALFVLFVIGFTIVLTAQGEGELVYGATPLLLVVLLLGMLAAILTLGVAVSAILVWRERIWSLAGRTFYTLVAVAAVAFVWELAFWNLLGVHV
ncbi:MAG TPA: serine hydrolase [Ktedonobacterales bacterium]